MIDRIGLPDSCSQSSLRPYNPRELAVTRLPAFRPERVRSGQISEANPPDDRKNTRRIADVYVDGTKVDRAALARQFKG